MKKIVCLLLMFWVGSVSAIPITIDFDDLGSGVVVGDHYADLGVTFQNAVTNSYGTLPGGSDPTSISHTGLGYQPTPANPIEAFFSSTIDTVSLTGVDVGGNGFMLSAFAADNTLLATDEVFGTGAGVGEFFTLSLFAEGISYIQFSQVTTGYGDGVVFDNLVFDTVSVAEPSSVLLLCIGLISLGITRRKLHR